MENINSPESLKSFKELLSANTPTLKEEFIESVTNVQAVLKRYYESNFLSPIKDIVYTENFVDYIIDAGLKKSSKFDFKEIFQCILSVYTVPIMELFKDKDVAWVYECNANKDNPLEIDFDFDSGIIIKHKGAIIKKEFDSISRIEDRIKELRESQKSRNELKANTHLAKELPSLKSILK